MSCVACFQAIKATSIKLIKYRRVFICVTECNCRLMESGLLPKEVAKKVFEKKQKKGMQQRITSPVKSGTTVKKSTKSVTVKKASSSTPNSSAKKKTMNSTPKPTKKRKAESSSSEDDDSDFDVGSAKPKKRKVA
ncbi:hypothetical protein QL285_065982 [Trifolium repens]|nr:hypothetical protein QL285_065982 [Trifolium repens]